MILAAKRLGISHFLPNKKKGEDPAFAHAHPDARSRKRRRLEGERTSVETWGDTLHQKSGSSFKVHHLNKKII